MLRIVGADTTSNLIMKAGIGASAARARVTTTSTKNFVLIVRLGASAAKAKVEAEPLRHRWQRQVLYLAEMK